MCENWMWCLLCNEIELDLIGVIVYEVMLQLMGLSMKVIHIRLPINPLVELTLHRMKLTILLDLQE